MSSRIGPIGPDIDLDQEVVYAADGRRLSEDLAAQIGEAAIQRHRAGRPSVTGGSEHTPALTVRVPAQTRQALEAIAAVQGLRLSDVTRAAITEYIVSHS